MSLINEALKKAQKQRTGESPPLSALPAIGGESARHIARRAHSTGFNALLLRLGLGVGALVVVIVGLVIFLRRPAPPASTPVRPATPVVTAAPPASALPSPSPAPAPAQFVLKIPTVTAPTPPLSSGQTAATSDPVKAPPEPVAAPAKPPAKMDLRGITYIETLRVTGIRASATDSKVLMNDRVYRPGNIVEHALGLKLIDITANSLTFEDEQGARYTRNF